MNSSSSNMFGGNKESKVSTPQKSRMGKSQGLFLN